MCGITGRLKADHPHRLWQLIVLERWFRQFIDATSTGATAAGASRLFSAAADDRLGIPA